MSLSSPSAPSANLFLCQFNSDFSRYVALVFPNFLTCRGAPTPTTTHLFWTNLHHGRLVKSHLFLFTLPTLEFVRFHKCTSFVACHLLRGDCPSACTTFARDAASDFSISLPNEPFCSLRQNVTEGLGRNTEHLRSGIHYFSHASSVAGTSFLLFPLLPN